MPLTFVKGGEFVLVVRVGGDDISRQHLADMGFVPGAKIKIISQHDGDVIVNVKDSHLAITKQMAEKIFVKPERTIS